MTSRHTNISQSLLAMRQTCGSPGSILHASAESFLENMKNTEAFAWQPLLDDVLHESDKEQLQKKLGELEGTMFFRFQELQKSPDGAVEVSKLQNAASMLLEVKINKLGFPVTGLRGLRNRAAK